MMTKLQACFNGRVIFDHIPKTAGTAVHSWLTNLLGAGCVSPQTGGSHRDLIRQYGGDYSIINAHIHFNDKEGLDNRYKYITLLRDPIDRVLSSLFFTINNKDISHPQHLSDLVNKFINSNGQEVDAALVGGISNYYVEHFCLINGSSMDNDADKYAAAFAAIKCYEIVGLYEEMHEFLADVADLIILPAPKTINRVNVTSSRPALDQLPPKLYQRIIELNQLDIQLYKELVEWKKSVPPRERKITSVSPWQKLEPVRNRVFTTSDIPEIRAKLREGYDIIHGQVLSFDVDFLLNRNMYELEAGIHIFDENRSWAFGTNSTLQGKSYTDVSAGSHRITHYLIADLPAGKYTAGFAFAERLPEGRQLDLAWYDVLCSFQIRYDIEQNFAGYVYLPSEMTLKKTTLVDNALLVEYPSGRILPIAMPESIPSNDQCKILVKVFNNTKQLWIGDSFRPVRLSYHWHDLADTPVVFDGLRTNLPEAGIAPCAAVDIEMIVQAPAAPGRYWLIMTLVQEMGCWFEEKGFEPTRIEVAVT